MCVVGVQCTMERDYEKTGNHIVSHEDFIEFSVQYLPLFSRANSFYYTLFNWEITEKCSNGKNVKWIVRERESTIVL